jgi:uncharacterized membrane protein
VNKVSASKVASVLFWHAIDILFFGVAFKFLAEWYIAPTFHTGAVTWARAFGLVIIARLLVQRHNNDEEQQITFQNLVFEAVVPALFTEAGYLIHHFMGP